MNSAIDDEMSLSLLRHAHHHLVVRGIGEEIDLEIGAGDDLLQEPTTCEEEQEEEHKQLLLVSFPSEHQGWAKLQQQQQGKRKKKVVKKWREEWADTYRWAYVEVNAEGTSRIFCSVCREYGRKHRRNPYGNEGSRNMQMSALEEHNNSLLHKEALRLQLASKDRILSSEGPIYVKALISKTAGSILEAVLRRDPHEVEFVQSVQEVVHSLEPVLARSPQSVHILERLLEPERMIIFQVPWVDDKGEKHVNRGYRVQFSQVLGPCRGGLRFHPDMNLSVAKFLGFQQTLKNALLPYKLGGAGGGSDFDPKGKSENEIMRFCQSFMKGLFRHLGPDQDLPAEDMGVGPREMGYLFGQYRRLAGHFQGSFTGPRSWSGSNLRTEATGYGLVCFALLVLEEMNKHIKGLRCIVSGAGKIAMHVLVKLHEFGALPITISDSRGYLLDEDGFDYVKLTLLRDIKAQQRSLRDYLKSYAHAKYFDDAKPWNERCDLAFPCAAQNEIDQCDAVALVNSGCRILIEGSNMPCTHQAIDVFRKAKVLVAPAKAASAGGVGVGELELSQECNLIQFENELQECMKQIYRKSMKAASDYGFPKDNPEALVHGGNLVAFQNLAEAMTEQGFV